MNPWFGISVERALDQHPIVAVGAGLLLTFALSIAAAALMTWLVGEGR